MSNRRVAKRARTKLATWRAGQRKRRQQRGRRDARFDALVQFQRLSDKISEIYQCGCVPHRSPPAGL